MFCHGDAGTRRAVSLQKTAHRNKGQFKEEVRGRRQ
jgi:hypothetical protein